MGLEFLFRDVAVAKKDTFARHDQLAQALEMRLAQRDVAQGVAQGPAGLVVPSRGR